MSYMVPQSDWQQTTANIGSAISALFGKSSAPSTPVPVADSGPPWLMIGAIGGAALLLIMLLKKKKH